jgi:hypothetical protein
VVDLYAMKGVGYAFYLGGGVGQWKGDGTWDDFLIPAVSGVSTARSSTSGLCLSRKPDTSGGTPSSRVIMIALENF